MKPLLTLKFVTTAGLVCLGLVNTTNAQTVDPYYSGYTIRDLGPAEGSPGEGVPGRYGGLTFKSGDTNTLLIGGDGNSASAKIYSIKVKRDANRQITGFTGSASAFADAYGPFGGGIDGGLAYGPDGILFYTTFSDNSLGQIKPGSSVPDSLVDVNPDNVDGRPEDLGSLVFVPTGLPGAGRMKLLDYGRGYWYDVTLAPDGNGTYEITGFSAPIMLGLGTEGAFYVKAGSPKFPQNSVLICDYTSDSVYSYEVNANGDPVPDTKRKFISGLEAVEGGAEDPLTGDFVFSSFGGAHVWVVTGFNSGLKPPVVNITSPTNNAKFNDPAEFYIEAAASQENGIISQVEFFVDNISVGIDKTSPYSAYAEQVRLGSHVLAAIASGNGLSSTSTVSIAVGSLALSTQITEPENNTYYSAPARIEVLADAWGTALSQIGFLVNGARVDSITAVPPGGTAYRGTITSLAAGAYRLQTVAEGVGMSVTSAPVNIIVTNPPPPEFAVTILAPENNSTTCECCINVLTADATLTSGTVASVHYYIGTNHVGQASGAPYRFMLPSLIMTTNQLTAVAYDTGGRSVTSSVVTLRVSNSLPSGRVGAVQIGTNITGICFRGSANSSYVIESTTNFASSTVLWKPVATNVAPSATVGGFSVLYTNMATEQKMFFRARKQ